MRWFARCCHGSISNWGRRRDSRFNVDAIHMSEESTPRSPELFQ